MTFGELATFAHVISGPVDAAIEHLHAMAKPVQSKAEIGQIGSRAIDQDLARTQERQQRP